MDATPRDRERTLHIGADRAHHQTRGPSDAGSAAQGTGGPRGRRGALHRCPTARGRLGGPERGRQGARVETGLGDPELDDALLAVQAGVVGTKVSRLVELLPGSDRVLERLVSSGELVEESQRKLGLFTVRRRYPAPAAARDEVVGRLRSVLLGQALPDGRTAMLVVVPLSSTNLRHWVGREHVKGADRRAREILEGLPEHEQRLAAAIRAAVVSGNEDSTVL